MAFNDLVNALDDTCLTLFGETATFIPQSGHAAFESDTFQNTMAQAGDPLTITGITSPAPMEDFAYGVPLDPAVVYFFVGFLEITPRPSRGDTITYGGATYDISDVLVDRCGGATLKLRRNA